VFAHSRFNSEQFSAASIRFLIESRKIRFSGKTGCSGLRSMHSVTICSAEPSLAKSDGPVSEILGSRNSRNSDESNKMITVDPND
jgi:hypothetical protein